MLWERLRPREKAICELLCAGINPYQIAKSLNLKKRTVKDYLSTCYRLCEVDPTRHGYIALAVALTYDRHPELVPFAVVPPSYSAANCSTPIA